MSQFIYLLNAMEHASQADHPDKMGYARKRQAVLEYVEKLEASRGEAVQRITDEMMAAGAAALEGQGRSLTRLDAEKVYRAMHAERLSRSEQPK